MKKHALFVVTAFVFTGIMIGGLPALAQQSSQQGGFRAEAPKILCDALLLKADKAEKVISTYNEVRTQVMESSQGSTDFQNMSAEERRERMTKIQSEIAAKLKPALKDTLSATELDALEPILARRVFFPVPEMRALRLIEPTDALREKLLPLTLKLAKTLVSPFPFPPGQPVDEEALKTFEKEKASFIAKVSELLNEEQKKAWETKTKETQKEVDDMRERMQQRFGNR